MESSALSVYGAKWVNSSAFILTAWLWAGSQWSLMQGIVLGFWCKIALKIACFMIVPKMRADEQGGCFWLLWRYLQLPVIWGSFLGILDPPVAKPPSEWEHSRFHPDFIFWLSTGLATKCWSGSLDLLSSNPSTNPDHLPPHHLHWGKSLNLSALHPYLGN